MEKAFYSENDKTLMEPSASSSASDFDFLLGTHRVHHRKLKKRLAQCEEWIEFEGTHSMESLLGGIGNLEQHWMMLPGGEEQGIALRLFNAETRLWSIYWASNKTRNLEKPVVGYFEQGVGTFLGRDTFEGKSILIKFCWDVKDPRNPVWSQAFSEDEGRHWEWNWFMYFSRLDDAPAKGYPVSHTLPIGVIELRNYRMQEGAREGFISYFEEHLLTPQAEVGGYPLGGYRLKGADDRFCWIRGFTDMSSRSKFLPGFYQGPVWSKHRAVANSYLANNDDVYLLRPVKVQEDKLVALSHLPASALLPQGGIMVVDLLCANTKRPLLEKLWAQHYLPLMQSNGLQHYSLWVSEETPNDFPHLPVFQDPNLLVQISFYPDERIYLMVLQKTASLLSYSLKAQIQDTLTHQHTWILYPTQKTLL
jgi:hypothetical protein